MNAMRAAMGLLTRIPMGRHLVDASGAAAFPLVGALIGMIGGLACLALAATGEPVIAAIAAIGVMALVSGGLHLDGLADTADALMAPDAVRAEAARRDPTTGTGGVVTLIVVIGAQVAALASVAGGAGGPVLAAGACVTVGAVSRLVPIAGAWLWRRRARRDGFGAWFIDRLRPLDVTAAVAFAIGAVAVVVGLTGSLALLAGTAVGALAGLVILGWISWRREGLDGDALGASVELTVAVSLGLVAVLA